MPYPNASHPGARRAPWVIAALAGLLLPGAVAPVAASTTIIDSPPSVGITGPGVRRIDMSDRQGLGLSGHRDFNPRRDVDVGLVLPPEHLEHWRSNYVPDNYRLNGYDGVNRGDAKVCRRRDGSTTWSTGGMECAEGESPPEGGRVWTID